MVLKNMTDGKKDGIALVFLKDGELYPIGLTEQQLHALDLVVGVAMHGSIKVFTDKPMGKATSVL